MITDTIGNISLINGDCLEVLRELPDNSFDLAIVDPPYGIGEDGSKNHTRSKCTIAKDYHGFSGGDKLPPLLPILLSYKGLAVIKLSLGQIILSAEYHKIAHVGLCGIKIMARQILPIVS